MEAKLFLKIRHLCPFLFKTYMDEHISNVFSPQKNLIVNKLFEKLILANFNSTVGPNISRQ